MLGCAEPRNNHWMNTLATTFKAAVRSGPKFGLSCAIPSAHTAEILAGSAFDFLLIDAEHPPTNPAIVHTQLMALARGSAAALIKLPSLEPNLLKQYLDLGPDGLMAPNIDTAAEAKTFVSLTRYPPNGVRGIAAAVRATGHTRNKAYVGMAEHGLCRSVVIESRTGIDNLEAICAVDGIDVVFFGPSDLAAQLGHIGQSSNPAVVAAVENGIKRVRAAGCAAGVVSSEADIDRYRALGVTMFVVGSDMSLFAQTVDGLAERIQRKHHPELSR
jgi:4-hydroxy-2-oxoheptanedioate aldolase